MSKPKGFMFPELVARGTSHEKPCECRRCGLKWTGEFPGPMYTNGVKAYDYCSECVGPEACPSCKSTDFAIARNMRGTRFCGGCGESWEPRKSE